MAILSCLANLPHIIKILLVLENLPTPAAFQGPNVFPDVTFKFFSDFVQNTFKALGLQSLSQQCCCWSSLYWRIQSYSVYMLNNNVPNMRRNLVHSFQLDEAFGMCFAELVSRQSMLIMNGLLISLNGINGTVFI